MAAGYFTYTRASLWLLVAFLALLAFAAINDQWIGYVREGRCARAARAACACPLSRKRGRREGGGAAGAPRNARAARAAGPGRRLTAAPRPPLPSQAVFIGLLVILLIVDAMFGNDADFIFDPSIKNYERTQARRAE